MPDRASGEGRTPRRQPSEERVDEEGLRRITIKVTDETYDAIRAMSRERGITITELIKRALVVDDFFHRRRDHQVVLEKDGVRTEVVLLL